MPIRLEIDVRCSLQLRNQPVCHKSNFNKAAVGIMAQALLTHLRNLKDAGTIIEKEFLQLVVKSVEAIAAGG